MRIDVLLIAVVMIASAVWFAIELPYYLKPVAAIPVVEVLMLFAVAMGKEKAESHS